MRTVRLMFAGSVLMLAAALLPAQPSAPSAPAPTGLPTVQPGQPLRLNLEQAIGLGLANSSEIRSKAIGVAQAKLDVASARSGYYPSLSATLGYTHLFEQPTFGGMVTGPTDPLAVKLQLGQVVATFGKRSTGVRLAEAGVRSAELALAEAQRSLSTQIQRGFYGYILAEQALSINRQTLFNKQEALDVARRKFEAGVASDFEVLQAEADVEGFRPTLIAAENQVRFALLSVRNLLNIPPEQSADFELVGELATREVSLDREALIGQALAHKYELASLRQGLAASGLQEALSRQAAFPTVSAFVGWTAQSGMQADGSNQWFGSGSWSGDLTAGLSVSVPLSAWAPWSAESASRAKARLAVEDLKLSLGSAESGIRLAVEKSLLAIEEQKQKIRSGEKNIELADRLYGSAREQYARGYISSLELRDAQLRLAGARLAHLQTVYGWTLALIDLEDAVGAERL